jgi:sugar lactone lactonase YvrE
VIPEYVYTGLNHPSAICIDTSGNLFVTNETSSTVTKISSDGLHVIENYVNTDLYTPEAICINSSGVLFIANIGDSTITKAIVEEPIVTPGYVSTGLSYPYGICIDSSGNLFVANTGDNTVTKISADGLTVTPGYVSTGLSYPSSLFIDSLGNLFVTNMADYTITKVSPDGSTVTPGYVSTGLSSPSGICIDAAGKLFVTNAGDNTVTKISADGLTVTPNFVTGLSFPSGICIDQAGVLFIANFDSNKITRAALSNGVLMAGGTWPTVRTSLTNVNTLGFNGSASFISCSKSPSATDQYESDFWSTNIIIDTFGSLWAQGIAYSGQTGVQVYYGEPSNLAIFTHITVGVYCPGASPGIRAENTLNLPQMTSINGGVAHSIAVDINGDLWVCGADRYINPVSATDSMGKYAPTPWGSFEYNRVFQQSTARSDTINFFTINNRDNGAIGTSTTVPALGTLTNITNDSNGKIYFNTVKNTSNSYPVLLSRTSAGLVTCVPPITVIKAGDQVQFSVTSLISNGTVATVTSSGFYLSVTPPVSVITNLPVLVTVGAVASQGCTYSTDYTFNTKLIGTFGTSCYSHVDRFDNYYLANVDSSTGTSTLKYKSWQISVSNSPCKNCRVEVDFLNNIYFVGDYSATSAITGGGTFPITWSGNGGTFIMKINQIGSIKWIIQIKNYTPTQYPIITKIHVNNFTGAGYISGYISSHQTGGVTSIVNTSTNKYTIELPNIIQSQYISNGKYGFEFIFDPSGNLDPQIISVPTNDFFQVPYKNLIGLHPVSTLPIPDFYPPQYVAWPPVSILNSTYDLSPSVLFSTSSLSNASSGNGKYEVQTSSVYVLQPSPGVYVLDEQVSGVHAFDYRDYTPWTTSFGYYYNTGYYYYASFLTTPSGALFGEYIWVHLPTATKAAYASILESPDDYALDYTYLGSNDGSMWEPIFQVTGNVTVTIEVTDIGTLTYKVSDASKLYPGMTINTGNIKIISVDHLNNTVVLSSSAYTESLTFIQVQNKALYLNSQSSYSYYAYSVQRKKPANASYYEWFSVYKLIYYEVKY